MEPSDWLTRGPYLDLRDISLPRTSENLNCQPIPELWKLELDLNYQKLAMSGTAREVLVPLQDFLLFLKYQNGSKVLK
jgi:hypothetical protein